MRVKVKTACFVGSYHEAGDIFEWPHNLPVADYCEIIEPDAPEPQPEPQPEPETVPEAAPEPQPEKASTGKRKK